MRTKGYVLLSVLIALIAITGLVAATARHSIDGAARIALSEHAMRQGARTADLVAHGITMAEAGLNDFDVPRHDLWVRLQPATGLVDLNAAPLPLIAAVLEAEGVGGARLAELDSARAGRPVAFRSVTAAFDKLGIARADRAALTVHFTVETGYDSVNPDDAAPHLSSALTQAMAAGYIAPESGSAGDIVLLLTAAEEGEPETPAFYLERSRMGEFRLRGYRAD